MLRNRISRGWLGAVVVVAASGLGLAVRAGSGEPPGAAEPAPATELPVELRFVPADAALFLHADVAAIWNHAIVQSIRKADGQFVAELTERGQALFGLTLDDVQSVTLFAPSLKQPDSERVGVVVTFKKAFDKEKIESGAKKILPQASRSEIRVTAVNERTALVLVNLGDEYAKPQPGQTGPLTAALKEAATGKHALVAGITVANLPDEILRADEVPAAFRPFQPLSQGHDPHRDARPRQDDRPRCAGEDRYRGTGGRVREVARRVARVDPGRARERVG